MSKSKQLGTLWETAIVNYLLPKWPTVERRALTGALDKGDIAGLPGVVIEAKNHGTLKLSAWVAEAQTEAVNAGAWLGVVWVKRRGKASAADAYVVMSGEQFAALLDKLGVAGGQT